MPWRLRFDDTSAVSVNRQVEFGKQKIEKYGDDGTMLKFKVTLWFKFSFFLIYIKGNFEEHACCSLASAGASKSSKKPAFFIFTGQFCNLFYKLLLFA